MTDEILIPTFIFLFIVGMSLHARIMWILKEKYPQLHTVLDEPGLFHARNFKAVNFTTKQAFSPNEKYSDLTTLCRVKFWIEAIYIFVFISLAIGVVK